jgi:hypothetical protein
MQRLLGSPLRYPVERVWMKITIMIYSGELETLSFYGSVVFYLTPFFRYGWVGFGGSRVGKYYYAGLAVYISFLSFYFIYWRNIIGCTSPFSFFLRVFDRERYPCSIYYQSETNNFLVCCHQLLLYRSTCR